MQSGRERESERERELGWMTKRKIERNVESKIEREREESKKERVRERKKENERNKEEEKDAQTNTCAITFCRRQQKAFVLSDEPKRKKDEEKQK